MNKYILVLEDYEIKWVLFWKRTIFFSSDIAIIEADSGQLPTAKAGGLQQQAPS